MLRGLIFAVVVGLGGIAAGESPGGAAGELFNPKNNPDGSYESVTRAEDGRTLTKRLMSADHKLLRSTVYRLSKGGMPLTSDIFDAQGTRLLKSRFGYRKDDGKLVEEQIFDTRNPRKDNQGVEIPVERRFFPEAGK